MHSARTAIATTLSVLAARLIKMPEAYWAAVTTTVVMQSTLGAAWQVSSRRFVGTALGAVAGAILGTCLHAGIVAFTTALFLLGLVCGLLRLDQSAYRFAGITLTIVALVPREAPAWITASHRFVEVSVGIVVALALTALWPIAELEPAK